MALAFTIYHFLPMTHVRGAVPMLERLLREGHRPILDLEDSVSCIFDPIRNEDLKHKARLGLLRLAEVLKDRPLLHDRLLVRINQRDSPHHALDLDVMKKCHDIGFAPGILLSKTHRARDLLDCKNDLFLRTGKVATVVPIIESVEGLHSLETIVTAMPREDRVAVFGYFDYALEAGHWPLMKQTEAAYWQLFRSARSRAERHDCALINSPHASWQKEDELSRIKSYLLATGRLPTGMCSVGAHQTSVLMRDVEPNATSPDMQSPLPECPQARASWIVAQFEAARCHQRSFAVADQYFVTPHEYQLAKRYLQQQG